MLSWLFLASSTRAVELERHLNEELLGFWRAGDKLVELVEWLRAGAVGREAPLLDALSQAPLPRKAGAPSHNQNIAAPAGAQYMSCCCPIPGM